MCTTLAHCILIVQGKVIGASAVGGKGTDWRRRRQKGGIPIYIAIHVNYPSHQKKWTLKFVGLEDAKLAYPHPTPEGAGVGEK